MKKLLLSLLPLSLLVLVACGGNETYSEVTDASAKSAALKAAQDSFAADKAYKGILCKGQGTKKNSGGADYVVYADRDAKIENGIFSSYIKVAHNSDNYYTIYENYSEADSKYYICFFGIYDPSKVNASVSSASSAGSAASSASNSASASGLYISFRYPAEDEADAYKNLSAAEASKKLRTAVSMPDISTMQTDSSKVFKGSAGSYKLVDNSVSNTSYVYYLSKSGDMTRNESSSSAWSGYVDIAYDTKVPPANLSSFIIPSDANGNPDETKIAADKVKMKTIIDFVDAGE